MEIGYFRKTLQRQEALANCKLTGKTIYLAVGKEGNLTVRNIKPESSKGTSTKRCITTSFYLAIFCHPHLKLTVTKIITKFRKIKAYSQIQQ